MIVGFSIAPNQKPKVIYTADRLETVEHINAYLLDAADIFVESRSKPLCDVPEIGIGNKPIDGGNYLFTKEEMDEFIKSEPASAAYFKPWYGASEFVNQRPRYCLWLGDCSPSELRRMPHCMARVQAVRDFRLASSSAGTVKLAEKPTRFHVENMPRDSYIIVPRHTSQSRKYIPMGFVPSNVLCGDANLLIADAGLFHLGVLLSNVHNAWIRAVCGRIKSDYRYSKDIVYNNFPWPTPTDAQKAAIAQTAQAILDARAAHPDCSLADLYDEVAMPADLRKAHQQNDKAVMAAYGFGKGSAEYTSEAACVAALMRLYQEMTKKQMR